MGLADDLARLQGRESIEDVIEALDPVDREQLLAVMDDRSVNASEISAVLVGNGFLHGSNDPAQMVRRYRLQRRRGHVAR